MKEDQNEREHSGEKELDKIKRVNGTVSGDGLYHSAAQLPFT